MSISTKTGGLYNAERDLRCTTAAAVQDTPRTTIEDYAAGVDNVAACETSSQAARESEGSCEETFDLIPYPHDSQQIPAGVSHEICRQHAHCLPFRLHRKHVPADEAIPRFDPMETERLAFSKRLKTAFSEATGYGTDVGERLVSMCIAEATGSCLVCKHIGGRSWHSFIDGAMQPVAEMILTIVKELLRAVRAAGPKVSPPGSLVWSHSKGL
jgi:hypothetical protein